MSAEDSVSVDPFKVRGMENGQIVEIYEKPNYDKEGNQLDPVTYIKVEKGNARSVFDGILRPKHTRDFPKCWLAFKNREKMEDIGTSLSMLPGFPEHLALDYGKNSIYSIESLASLDDMAIEQLPHGNNMRRHARTYLDMSNPENIIRRDKDLIAKAEQAMVDKLLSDPAALQKLLAAAQSVSEGAGEDLTADESEGEGDTDLELDVDLDTEVQVA